MKEKLQALRNLASNTGARIAVGTMTLVAASHASAAGEDPIGSLFDSIDLSGINTKALAMCVIIVGVALVFKGPDLVKRVIRKL